MPFEKQYTGLKLWFARREDQGMWQYGITVEGADIILGGKKLGGVDSDLETARLEAAKSAPSDTTPQPQ
jgi:hypothetical protein